MEMHKNIKICCDFCRELNGNRDNSFHEIYARIADTRIIWSSESFVVLPTLGQLFENSLLILPKQHYELMSSLPASQLDELEGCYELFYDDLSPHGKVIAFEHGAKSDTRGGCGIYHAHLHILPVPDYVDLFSLLDHECQKYDSFKHAYRNTKSMSEYLLAINPDKTVGVLDLSCLSGHYPSQFFRRKLSEYFNLKASWNWREYTYPEERLMNLISNAVSRKFHSFPV